VKKGIKIKTAFDEYTLIKQVGSGGNGHVFSAEASDGNSVAIKFVEKNIPTNKLKRFKNEIFFCERHSHKNIVEILDHGFVDLDGVAYVFYVMPLYAETLRDKMKRTLNPDEILTIFTGLLEGLSYAHKADAIHRDIKPENIMFKANCNDPIICDFGIAHFAEEDLLTIIETKKGDRMANFQYAAPEQRVKGGRVSAQTDIYAAALILNEMFTGEIPQAADYKTIASVAPDYKYLDAVFGLLYKQSASDRLYPEENILTEIKIRAEQHKREQEKRKLQNIIDDSVCPKPFDATVISKEYRDGRLVFTFNQELPYEWFAILSRGNLGSYTALMGHGPEDLERDGKYAISMPLRGTEAPDTIKRIVGYVLDWIPKANAQYTAHIKYQALQEQRAKEARRKTEIERLEKENAISDLLAQL